MDATRLEAMDSQRFDLSKRRSRSTLSIKTKATMGHVETQTTSATTSRSSTLDTQANVPWAERTYSTLPSVDSSPVSSSTETDSHSSNSSALTGSSSATSTPPSSSASVASVTLEDDTCSGQVDDVTVFDHSDRITTRTIIYPAPSSPLLRGCFSRPSSPFLRPSSPKFSTLNCFGSTDAFEEDIDLIQSQRAKELAGTGGVEVFVTHERSVFTEERWREAVQEVLYGNCDAEGIRRRAVHSRVEAQ